MTQDNKEKQQTNENKNMTETHAGVVDDYIHIFANISTVRWQDAVLGLTCAVVLLAMRVRIRDQNNFQKHVVIAFGPKSQL